ncbi:transport protein Sec23-like protein [Tanacetum coccineum]
MDLVVEASIELNVDTTINLLEKGKKEQETKAFPSFEFCDLSSCSLFQSVVNHQVNSLVKLTTESGETFFEGLLTNGLLLNLVCKCGEAEEHVYVFVVDTCMVKEESRFAKLAVQQALEFFPDNALVGFVSFEMQVQVYELGCRDISKVYVFQGSKEMSKKYVLDKLGIHGGVGGGDGGGGRRMGDGQGHGFQKGVVQGGFASSRAVRFLFLASEGALSVSKYNFCHGNKAKLDEVLEAQERYEEERNGFIEEQDQMKKDMELMMKEIKRSSQ